MNTHVINFSKRARIIGVALSVTGLTAVAESSPKTEIAPKIVVADRESEALASDWYDTTTFYVTWILQLIGASPDDIIKATTLQDKMNLVTTYYSSRGLPTALPDPQRIALITDIRAVYDSLPAADVPLDPTSVAVFKKTLELMWLDLGLPLSDL
jgi:hypothetical protein